MILKNRIYWVLGLVVLLALTGAAVTMTSRLTSAEGPSPTTAATTSDQQGEVDDANEADDAAESTVREADTDNVEEQSGDQNAAEDGDVAAPSGTLDDGKDLLPQAGITIDQAIAAAQTAASGSVGEIDLEQYQGKLVFNVDVGDKDVKVDASNGTVLTADLND
jgi:uncharacterized membrane protein YkoI